MRDWLKRVASATLFLF